MLHSSLSQRSLEQLKVQAGQEQWLVEVQDGQEQCPGEVQEDHLYQEQGVIFLTRMHLRKDVDVHL